MGALYTDEEDPLDLLAQKTAMVEALQGDASAAAPRDPQFLDLPDAVQPEQFVGGAVTKGKPLTPNQVQAQPAEFPTKSATGSPAAAADPTAASVPMARRPAGASMWGPGLEHQERSPFSGFDFRRAFVGAGHGDVAAYDRNRAEELAEPERREQKRMSLALLDPLSPESARARTEYVSTLKSYAQAPGLPQGLRDELKTAAENAGKLSAAQMDRHIATVKDTLGIALKGAAIEATNRRADQQQTYQNLMLQATQGNQAAMRRLQEMGLIQNDRHFNAELERKREADKNRAFAAKLKTQSKSVDKKAIGELGTLESMTEQLEDAEKIMPDTISGPGTDALLAAEGVANSSMGKTVGLDSVFNAVTPEGTQRKLGNTRMLDSAFEQAIAKMKLERHGASFTASEKATVDKWKPGTQLGPEDNKLLLSALRKYIAAQSQQRLLQVYKETGMPVYLPPGQHLSLEDVRKLKANYEAINLYDDDMVAGTADRVNEILAPYGGHVGAARASPGQQPQRAAAPSGKPARASAPVPPDPWPGAKEGQQMRDDETGIVWQMAGGKLKQVN